MLVTKCSSINFGQAIKVHRQMTLLALKDNNVLTDIEKNMVSQFVKEPDLIRGELEDFNAGHFYDALSEDPSFGRKNDDKNNALSKFLYHNGESEKAVMAGNRELALREAGFAAHYLQDAATPPHVEHGNYLHKFFRLFMHKDFERGKKFGASSRLPFLINHYIKEEIPFSNLASLLHNTALYTVQPENHVSYSNKKLWPKIQQRTFNRGVNATKAYFDYVFSKLPKKI
ncbi:hypothetical protein IKQ21_03545 [bacterium]|nr:hypothetical protein [bacterium]